MFYPEEMTEVELIVPEKDLLAVTRLLSGQGVFHQADSSYLGTDKGTPNLWQERASAYSGLERRIQTLLQTLGLAEGRPPSGEFKDLSAVDTVRPLVEGIEQEVKKVTEQLNAETKNKEQLEVTLASLEPVADIDLDIASIRNPHYLYSALGMMPVANMARLQESLSRIPYVFLPLRQDAKQAVVWLAGSRANADILERAARSAYLNPVGLPEDYKGTPAQILKTLKQAISDSEAKSAALKKSLTVLGKAHSGELQPVLWNVRASRLLTDAIVRFGKLRYTYIVVGWVISSRLPALLERLKTVSKESMVEIFPVKREGASQDVPVSLNNPRLIQPFQGLVTNYGRPRYDELDPTLLMSISFPFIFGAMFGDIGHGLLLAVLGYLIASGRFLRSLRGLGAPILACGAMSIIFGFLYGSVFGFEELIHPIWMTPMTNIMSILIAAIGFGAIMLSLGFILGIYNAFRRRDWGRALVQSKGIAGLVLYWSLLGLAVSALAGSALLPNVSLSIPTIVFVVPIIIAGLIVMFSEVFEHLIEGHRPLVEGSFGTYFIQAFFELFESVISIFSNSLSYVRVGAFAVAHGFLSAAFFILGGLVGPEYSIGWWIMVLIGMVFIVGFEGLIVGIQTMRLQYYEFFSKFFTAGGTRFDPLTLKPDK